MCRFKINNTMNYAMPSCITNNSMSTLKCRGCPHCDGRACRGELPGMGGVLNSSIFIENVKAWKKYWVDKFLPSDEPLHTARLRLAPMAGGVQNVGWHNEEEFYFDMIEAAHFANLPLSIGDGAPDEKLEFGLLALKYVRQKGAVFLKPYPQNNLLQRVEKAKECSEIIGVDIDSFNIITMREQVSLEEKTAKDLIELKNKAGLPFAIKGVFSQKDIELVKEVKPEIAIVSNHGGRIDRPMDCKMQSTADFLKEYGNILKSYVDEVWVDGGVRRYQDVIAATALGAKQIMIGRPIISAMIRGGKDEVHSFVKRLSGNELF